MFCGPCKGYGVVVVPCVPPECRGLVPDVQEILPDGSVALHYANGLTALVGFPPCTKCRGRGQLTRALGWRWIERWAQRKGFEFPPIQPARFRGKVWRGGEGYACNEASGSL